MIGGLILWGHALAALLFAAAALAQWQRPRQGWAGVAFVVALALSALWALAAAGIGTRDVSTRLAEVGRNLAWLGFAFALVRRDRADGWALAAVYLVVAVVIGAGGALAIAEAVARAPAARAELGTALTIFRMMAAAGALVLARHLHAASPDRGAMRPAALALGLMWGSDLLLYAVTWATAAPGWTLAGRGFATAAAALLLGIAAQRRDDWTLALSRPAATRALLAGALIAYLALVAGLSAAAAMLGGVHGRAWQAAVVVGATAALLAFSSTSWLGAWAKVKLAKHLFRHRYDYRVEWQRFTDTLGSGGGAGGEPLEARVVAAVANLLDAPAGLLLLPDNQGLASATGWRWSTRGDGSATLAAHLLATRRIVEIDAVRAGLTRDDAAVLPDWMLAAPEAWALVPLVHDELLAGAVLLARPPVARALDWEDFDLLRVAGRQAASYLAEERAGRALAQAARFDEFNRRFAFILHDIKNLVSQQQLVARNAERHAENPAFRADMVATLKDSADRMTALLARLSNREAGPVEALEPVDAVALAHRIAQRRRAQHPIEVQGSPTWALAHPQRLEQVLSHLLQNAIEASADGVPVSILVGGGEGVTIEVRDRGVGMDTAFLRDELFRPFSSTKSGGFGLGAFEARQLVVAMGGTLTVTSAPGEGSCFSIVLPAAPALAAAA